jgi:xylulokinase
MGRVIGIDVSTTATKAVLIDASGVVRGIGVAEYGYDIPATLEPAGPAALVGRSVSAIRDVLAATDTPGEAVEAIGLTGQMHGLVLLDKAGTVLRPAILWNDQRTGAECDFIRSVVGPARLIEVTGNDALPGFTAPKLVWVRDHEPATWSRVAHVLPKDYSPPPTDGYRSTRQTVPGLSSTCRPRWSPRSSEPGHRPGLMPRTYEGPGPTAAAALPRRAGTPVVAGGVTSRPMHRRRRRLGRYGGTSLGAGVVFATTDRPIHSTWSRFLPRSPGSGT